MRRVDWQHRHRISEILRRTKQNVSPRIGTPVLKKLDKDLLTAGAMSCLLSLSCFRFAVHRALDGHVMAGMRRHLCPAHRSRTLRVGIVPALLGAMLLTQLGRGTRRPVGWPFYSHWLSEDPAVQSLSAPRDRSREQRRGY